MANVYLGKKYQSSLIQQEINTPNTIGSEEHIGFVITVEVPTTRLIGENVDTRLDIVLKPLYCKLDNIAPDYSFSFRLGASISGFVDEGSLLSDGLIRIRERDTDTDSASEIQFYNNYPNFDLAYISTDDMSLLTEFSAIVDDHYIVISGAEVTSGLPYKASTVLVNPVKRTYFSFKIEAELVQLEVDGELVYLRADPNSEIDLYPEMLFASPCPPYWRNPLPIEVAKRMLSNANKGCKIGSEDLFKLMSTGFNDWIKFTKEVTEAEIPSIQIQQNYKA